MGKILGIGGVILIIALGAYWYSQQKETQSASTESGATEKVSEETKGLVSSIKDAMSAGVAMSCKYSVTQGENTYESTVVVQGEKFKADAVVAGVTTHALFDGSDQYVWTENSKNGFKMSKSCLDEMSKTAGAAEDKTSPIQDAKAAFENAENVSCSPALNTDFSVPGDIIFADQCAQMKDSMKMMEQYKTQMPSGAMQQ